MSTIFKEVTIPFDINQMEMLGETDPNIYLISYEKSSLKGVEFIDYIINSSKICDICDYNNIDTKTKIQMMYRLINQQELVFLPSMMRSFILTLLSIKNIETTSEEQKNSFLTQDEIEVFKEYFKDKFDDYIKFFDSLFVFMLTVASIMVSKPKQDISYDDLAIKYAGVDVIDDRDIITANVCSVFFEPLFYRYYEKPINENGIYFYRQQFAEKMFREKNILSVLINDANYILMSLVSAFEKGKNIPERE